MNSDRLLIFGIPALVAVLVHLLFVFALEGGWTTASPTITAQPQVVQASLVSLSKPKPKPKPKSKPKAVEPKPEPKPAPTPAPKVEAPPPEPVVEQPESAPSVSQEERLAELQRELMAGFEALPDADEQLSNQEVDEVQQVAGLMQARITQNWRRPPSARNGMEVLLIISLVPTGEVVGISVSSSSGSTAFDRSAIAAVERVARFPEVTVLSISDFERYFRRFPLRFKPEDLRY
ncbi:MAG: TonB family protein [Pseudomonadota bacterium]|nr:TonB family protein [Pseudomonadota bacterium]